VNVFSFTGNLGNDCEVRSIPSGETVVSFNVAFKAGFGQKAVTSWARCSMWGKRGEAVAPYLLKGAQVGISGELSLRTYDDKSGAKATSLEVRVNDLTLLGGKTAAQSAPQPAYEDSDVPF